MTTSRLAPSPTGALHLGNAFAFVACWLWTRQRGGRLLLRIEDLDTPRIKAGAANQAIDDLRWLGLDWDAAAPLQSQDLAPCMDALERLRRADLIYPCHCTRSDIAASAPQAGDHELRYLGTCAQAPGPHPGPVLQSGQRCWRFRCPPGPVQFDDAWQGPQSFDPQAEVGDFIVATKAGLPSYQLACTVDDARQGVDTILRGADLLSSTARQARLRHALGFTTKLTHAHVPLVVGHDGRRLAKRHGDSRLANYRQQGIRPQRVLGLLAYWLGVQTQPAEISLGELAAAWVPPQPHPDPLRTFSPALEAWLTQHR